MDKPSKDELKKYKTDYNSDSIFASNARLLQSKWRNKKDYPI
jgi:hypothetical protein